MLSATYHHELGGYYSTPCNVSEQNTTLNFEFGGTAGSTIKVPLNQMLTPLFTESGSPICRLDILPTDGPLMFGDSFLRSAYVVYDLDNKQICLAQTIFNSTFSDIWELSITNATVPRYTTYTTTTFHSTSTRTITAAADTSPQSQSAVPTSNQSRSASSTTYITATFHSTLTTTTTAAANTSSQSSSAVSNSSQGRSASSTSNQSRSTSIISSQSRSSSPTTVTSISYSSFTSIDFLSHSAPATASVSVTSRSTGSANSRSPFNGIYAYKAHALASLLGLNALHLLIL